MNPLSDQTMKALGIALILIHTDENIKYRKSVLFRLARFSFLLFWKQLFSLFMEDTQLTLQIFVLSEGLILRKFLHVESGRKVGTVNDSPYVCGTLFSMNNMICEIVRSI